MPTYIRNSAIVGATGGALLTVYLFTNVQWYHDLLVWSWTNPWMWLIGVPCGVFAAVATDGE